METEETKEKDPFIAAKEAEARIKKLDSEIHHLKQRIQLSVSEEKAEAEEFEKEFRYNEKRIQVLKNQKQDLEICINKGLHGDDRIIAEAFQNHIEDLKVIAGKSGTEAKEIIDDKVMDLIKKSNLLTHELHVKDKYLADLKEQSKDIAWDTYNEFEAEHAQSKTMRRVRELENDYQKVEKNLMECQVVKTKYQAIQKQLRSGLIAYPKLIEDLEDKYREQQADVDQLIASGEKAHKRREVARKELTEIEADALRARQEKESIIAEYKKALKPKPLTPQRKSMDLRDTDAAEKWRQLRVEQEEELQNFRKDFEKIKEAIGISDIKDAEERFISQMETKKELSDLIKKAEEKLDDMKIEYQELQTKNESLRGAELARPLISLEKKLAASKLEKEEQLKRKSAAEAELQRIKKLSADVKSGLWQQLQLLEKYMKEDDVDEMLTTPDEEPTVIVTKIESLLDKTFEKLKDQDLEGLRNALKNEGFLQKMEPKKSLPSPGAARKMKPAEEEESSGDEDFEKERTDQKEKDRLHAETKKKQQGRGRMMML